jgi:hypothetical protein
MANPNQFKMRAQREHISPLAQSKQLTTRHREKQIISLTSCQLSTRGPKIYTENKTVSKFRVYGKLFLIDTQATPGDRQQWKGHRESKSQPRSKSQAGTPRDK